MNNLHLRLAGAFLPLLWACTPAITSGTPGDTTGSSTGAGSTGAGSTGVGSTGAGDTGSTGAGEGDPSLVCERRDPLINNAKPFDLWLGDWPKREDPYTYESYEIAASCEVTLAEDSDCGHFRTLMCPDENGAMHTIKLNFSTYPGPPDMAVVPTTGPVFLRAAEAWIYWEGDFIHSWLEVRAGGDATGALLLAGFIGDSPIPSWLKEGDEASESWYAPLSFSAGGSEACAEEQKTKCLTVRRSMVRVEAQGAQAVQLFDGQEGDVDVNGGYHVVARKALEQHGINCDVELPILDDFRVIIWAKSSAAP